MRILKKAVPQAGARYPVLAGVLPLFFLGFCAPAALGFPPWPPTPTLEERLDDHQPTRTWE